MSQQNGDDAPTNPPWAESGADDATQPFTPIPRRDAPEALQEELPRSFGRYRVVSRLGKGGFSRGGSFEQLANLSLSASRFSTEAGNRALSIGFRIARTYP
jgi:hypothetical protein